MANEQNLTKMGKARGLTTEEARRIGSAGGKKSVQVRKERKAIREMFEDKLRERGYKDIDVWFDNLMERAKDNSKDMEFALAIMGEKPKEQVEISQDAPFEVKIEVVE